MAIRLSDYVLGGIVNHNERYSTYGRLALRGFRGLLMFDLTGYPAPDLRERSFEFEVPGNDRPASPDDIAALKELKNQQVGPVHVATAAHRVRTGKARPGEDPAAVQYEQCLYLEWEGQNGRVVIELPFSMLRIATPEEIEERNRLEQEAFEARRSRAEAERPPADDPDGDPLADLFASDEEDDSDSGYNLVPEEFELEMERKARRTDLGSVCRKTKWRRISARWSCWTS